MNFKRCPGSMAFAQPKIEIVRCPHCGDDAEVWTDEAQGKCRKCGGSVCRTTTQSCIDWCKYARDCLGDEGLKKYQEMKSRLRKETLLQAADKHLPEELQRQRARTRIEAAEQILPRETAADPNVVLAAAALFEVTPAAEILQELGYPEGFVKEVSHILSHLQQGDEFDNVNFRVVRAATTRLGPAVLRR